MPIISRPTTTPTATRPATRCWSASRSAFPIRCGRAGDCAARYGGEEFAVLLPGCSADRRARGRRDHPPQGRAMVGGPAVTTVSVGVASLTPAAEHALGPLLDAADKALYAAKAGGRNQSVRRQHAEAVAGGLRSELASSLRAQRSNPVCAMHERSGLLRFARRNDDVNRATARHFSRYFFISARKPSRRSARAMPKAMLARRKPGFEPQSCRSPSNSTP